MATLVITPTFTISDGVKGPDVTSADWGGTDTAALTDGINASRAWAMVKGLEALLVKHGVSDTGINPYLVTS